MLRNVRLMTHAAATLSRYGRELCGRREPGGGQRVMAFGSASREEMKIALGLAGTPSMSR